MTPEKATLGAWPIADPKLLTYGDVLVGVYDNTVVTAYHIDGWTRDTDGRVTFRAGQTDPPDRWAHLIGQPNPGKPWGAQGDAWPVRFVDLVDVTHGDTPVHETPAGRRAVVDGVVLTVDPDGRVVVIAPPGRPVTVKTAAGSTT